MLLAVAPVILAAASLSAAHIVPWNKGMYCLNGNSGLQETNSDEAVLPVYDMNWNDWWMHGYDGCNNYPPPDGDFLELPAGGSFTVEMASNKGKTTLSFGGRDTTDWPDGENHPEPYNLSPQCIESPNLHAQNESMAAGSSFAISYVSDISQVTMENLVVFTVRKNTPFRRLASFDVPAAMPACPEGGCICVWNWIPNGCGISNMYMMPYKCRVNGATSTTPLGTPKPAVWCEDDPRKCVQGPKQIIVWHQKEGVNIDVDVLDYDLSGGHRHPGYNTKCGFNDGAQNDIFSGAPTGSSGNNEKGVDAAAPVEDSTPEAAQAQAKYSPTPVAVAAAAPTADSANEEVSSSTNTSDDASADTSHSCRKSRSLRKKAEVPSKRDHFRHAAGHKREFPRAL